MITDVHGAIAARIIAARKHGELPPDADVRRLAVLASSCMLALSIRGRSGATRLELRAVAQSFIAAVTGAAKPRKRARRRPAS